MICAPLRSVRSVLAKCLLLLCAPFLRSVRSVGNNPLISLCAPLRSVLARRPPYTPLTARTRLMGGAAPSRCTDAETIGCGGQDRDRPAPSLTRPRVRLPARSLLGRRRRPSRVPGGRSPESVSEVHPQKTARNSVQNGLFRFRGFVGVTNAA
jgi:hypothetical protein